MAGLQLSGLVSGIDTGSIITQLMAIEKVPRTKITLDQDATTKRQSLLQDLSTKVTTLKSANDDLKSVLSWLDTQTVETGDATKVTATRIGGAPPGGYDVAITQLASAERQTFSFVSPAADGTLDIANADGSARTSIALKAGATVDDAVVGDQRLLDLQALRGQRQRQPRPERQDDGRHERLRDHRRRRRHPDRARRRPERQAHDQRHAPTSARATRSPTRSPACSSRSRARPRSAPPSA